MPASSSLYALILAGGSGQRFWPLSRDRQPKQLLRLFDGKTMLESTIERLEGFVPKQNILVLTNHQQLDGVREVLQDFPQENIIAEPEKRDTAPAIALGIGWVAARDPQATMMVLPSDHLIKDTAQFQRALRTACSAAQESGALVTIGIKPTWPCPSYGYIERGAAFDLKQSDGVPVFEVVRFREKPKPEIAQEFFEQGNFTWNAGMFFWTLPAVRQDLQKHAAALAGLEEAHLVAIECGLDRLRASVVAEQVRILAQSGKVAAARAALRAVGIDGRSVLIPTASSTRRDETIAMAWLRVEMLGPRLAGAEKVAAAWLDFLQRSGATRSIVVFLLIVAKIAVLRGNRSKARRAVRNALELAAPCGWSQIFLDEGEVILSLIKEAYADNPAQETMPADALASRVVASMRGRAEVPREAVETAWKLARQYFRYGTGEPLLYRHFRHLGMPASGWDEGLAKVRWLYRRRSLLNAYETRGRWVQVAAHLTGRTCGSIRRRTVFL